MVYHRLKFKGFYLCVDVANLQQLLTEKESVIKAQEEHIASVTSRSEQDIQQLKKETEILRAQNEKLKRQLSHKNEGCKFSTNIKFVFLYVQFYYYS